MRQVPRIRQITPSIKKTRARAGWINNATTIQNNKKLPKIMNDIPNMVYSFRFFIITFM